MRMVLDTWDGNDINDLTDYKSYNPIGVGNGLQTAQATYIDMGTKSPKLSGITISGTSFTFRVQCLSSDDEDRAAQRDVLMQYFALDGIKKHLVGLDEDNSDKDWYLEGVVISPPSLEADTIDLYSITIALTEPYWIENDENVNTWNITASTETEVMSNVGNMPTLPRFELKPITAKGSNAIGIKTFYATHTNGYSGLLPVDITNSALDTEAMITAGELLASGNDLDVWINGAKAYRWFGGGGLDTTTTGVWSHLRFDAAPKMYSLTALDATTTPAAFVVSYQGGAVGIHENTSLQIGTEIIAFSTYTVNQAANTITFVPTLRGAKGSTKAIHDRSTRVYWIQNEVWVSHYNPDATAPVIDDDYKPCFDLTTSRNNHFDYVDNFGTSGLPQEFAPLMLDLGIHYSVVNNAGSLVRPYAVIGLALSSKLLGSGVLIDSVSKPAWAFWHPGGISHITATGEKWRNNSLFGAVTIEDNAGAVHYTEAIPSTVDTWEAVSIDEDTANLPYCIFKMTGGLTTTLPLSIARAELSEVSVDFPDPVVSTAIGVEQVAYNFNGTLENETTDEVINLNNILTQTNDTTTIDCEQQIVYTADGKRIRSSISFSGAVRDEWMTFAPGNNSITLTDVGTSQLQIKTYWRARHTI